MEARFLSGYISKDDVHRTTFYIMIIKTEIKETMFIVIYEIKK